MMLNNWVYLTKMCPEFNVAIWIVSNYYYISGVQLDNGLVYSYEPSTVAHVVIVNDMYK